MTRCRTSNSNSDIRVGVSNKIARVWLGVTSTTAVRNFATACDGVALVETSLHIWKNIDPEVLSTIVIEAAINAVVLTVRIRDDGVIVVGAE